MEKREMPNEEKFAIQVYHDMQRYRRRRQYILAGCESRASVEKAIADSKLPYGERSIVSRRIKK